MELLGHFRISLTMEPYSHLLPDAIREAVGRMQVLRESGQPIQRGCRGKIMTKVTPFLNLSLSKWLLNTLTDGAKTEKFFIFKVRPLSSAGQSTGFLILGSRVQIAQGAPVSREVIDCTWPSCPDAQSHSYDRFAR
jgi:hypothetical protein